VKERLRVQRILRRAGDSHQSALVSVVTIIRHGDVQKRRQEICTYSWRRRTSHVWLQGMQTCIFVWVGCDDGGVRAFGAVLPGGIRLVSILSNTVR